MNRDYEIQRLTVDIYNSTTQNILAEAAYESLLPVLSKASDYTAVVESASVDLSSMLLNPNPDFKILIFNNDKTGKYPELPDINNFFAFNNPIREVSDVIDWLYDIFHKKALPHHDLGHFDVDTDGNFTFKLQDATAYTSGDIEVFFNSRMKEILPEFLLVENITVNGDVYYKLDTEGIVPEKKQSRYTLSRLMTAVSIRFYTDMQTTPHLIHNPGLNTITRENIFATIALNNETFDVLNKYNMIYSPTQYRHVTLNNDDELRAFRLWIKIYYKGGFYEHHTMKPGDYSVVNIAFHPRVQDQQ